MSKTVTTSNIIGSHFIFRFVPMKKFDLTIKLTVKKLKIAAKVKITKLY